MEHIQAEEHITNRSIHKKYSLVYEKGEYSIICTHIDETDAVIDYCRVDNITGSRQEAYELYELIKNNDVSACTLYDVIYDFICRN